MLRAMWFVGSILILASCGGSQTEANGGPQAPDELPAVVPDEPAGRMRAVFERQLEALRASDSAAFTVAYAPDVFLLGPEADDVIGGLERAKVVAAALMPRTAVERIAVKEHAVRVAGARAGWSFHDVTVPGDAPIAYRVSTVYEQREAWRIVAQVWAVPISDDEAARCIQAGAFPELPDVTVVSSPDARELVEDTERWLATAAESSIVNDFILAGSAPDEMYVVNEGSTAPFRAMLEDGTASVAPLGRGIAARTAAGGAIAWVHYNQLTGIGPVATRVSFPMRMFEVLDRQHGAWRRVLVHVSLARPRAEACATPAPRQ